MACDVSRVALWELPLLLWLLIQAPQRERQSEIERERERHKYIYIYYLFICLYRKKERDRERERGRERERERESEREREKKKSRLCTCYVILYVNSIGTITDNTTDGFYPSINAVCSHAPADLHSFWNHERGGSNVWWSTGGHKTLALCMCIYCTQQIGR